MLKDDDLGLLVNLGTLASGDTVNHQAPGFIQSGYTNIGWAFGTPADGSGNAIVGLAPVDHDDEAMVDTGSGTLEGSIWQDFSNDGDPDNENLNNLGLEGALVTLFEVVNGVTNPIDTTSGAGGYYSFTDLPAGDYHVEMDTSTVDPSFMIQPPTTPLEYDATVSIGGTETALDFGFVIGTTAINGASLEAVATLSGVAISWTPISEDDVLGYHLYRDGERITANMMVATGASSYSLLDKEANRGRYELNIISNDLKSKRYGPVLAVRVAQADPVGEPTQTIASEAGQAEFISQVGVNSYLVIGFSSEPTVMDLSDPEAPVQLIGKIIKTEDGFATYFSIEPGRNITVWE